MESAEEKKELCRNLTPVDFEHPGFTMRFREERFFISYNRGKQWVGPFKMEIEKQGEQIRKLTSRTDYLVLGPGQCLLFLSSETGEVETDYQDGSFCAMTSNGGLSFRFLGWMTHDKDKRSVMSYHRQAERRSSGQCDETKT